MSSYFLIYFLQGTYLTPYWPWMRFLTWRARLDRYRVVVSRLSFHWFFVFSSLSYLIFYYFLTFTILLAGFLLRLISSLTLTAKKTWTKWHIRVISLCFSIFVKIHYRQSKVNFCRGVYVNGSVPIKLSVFLNLCNQDKCHNFNIDAVISALALVNF